MPRWLIVSAYWAEGDSDAITAAQENPYGIKGSGAVVAISEEEAGSGDLHRDLRPFDLEDAADWIEENHR
jgi:hypothetical protein